MTTENTDLNTLEAELERRKEDGFKPMTRSDVDKELRAHGYRLDGAASCYCNARYMSGALAGVSYPAAHIRVVSLVSGKPFANTDSPRDCNFRWLQNNRDRLFYVTRGHIAEI